MATVKSYTDLEQSRKLAEILPIESADMRYEYHSIEKDEIQEPMNGFNTSSFNWFKESDSFIYFPCWSLAALLEILSEYNLQRTDWGNKTEYKIVVTVNEDNYASKNYDNPLDACYEMIIKLHELKML